MRRRPLKYISLRPTMPDVMPTQSDADLLSLPLAEGFLCHSNDVPEAVGCFDVDLLAKSVEPMQPNPHVFNNWEKSGGVDWIIRQMPRLPGEAPVYAIPRPLAHLIPAFQTIFDDLYRRDKHADRYVPYVTLRHMPDAPLFTMKHTDFHARPEEQFMRIVEQYLVSTVQGTRHFPMPLSAEEVAELVALTKLTDKVEEMRQLEKQKNANHSAFYEQRAMRGVEVSFDPGTIVRQKPYVAHQAPNCAPRSFLRVNFLNGLGVKDMQAINKRVHPAYKDSKSLEHARDMVWYNWYFYPETMGAFLTDMLSPKPRALTYAKHCGALSRVPSIIQKHHLLKPAA